ncbi:MAG: hypothetical protein AABX16_04035 [Nanoarchaeota archaeon]
MINKKSISGPVILFIIILIIGIVIILFINSSKSPTGKAIVDTLQGKNCNYVEVPYTEEETYTETVPYEENIPLEFRSIKSSEENCGTFTNYIHCSEIQVTNIDTVGGIFEVSCNFRTVNRNLQDFNSGYVKPGDSVNIICRADIDYNEDVVVNYDVTPPTKIETRYKDVTRTRTITKYKQEYRCE